MYQAIKCTRRIEFDAAHRIVGHNHKCKYIHGHRFVLDITFESFALNDIGMVIDFALVKSTLNKWINDNLDHTLILNELDQSIGDIIEAHTGQKIYYLDSNPTAENIALHIKQVIIPQLFDLKEYKIWVRIYETPNCFVDV